ncbi:unnamed protein product (mitochondrion) [Plasmodiophora brassicae]|uniref:Uncharacterized protein n=1 Tax=Plasmodiophora brassicae TaxID=37360 RepID=A0A3P3Y424_PLABS|nr:unnamed protein product [Plasmodiophora brassicae]
MAAVSLSLKVTAPALFEKRDRILADGPVILAGAMRHYLDELDQAMASNIDVVQVIESVSNRINKEGMGLASDIDSILDDVNDLNARTNANFEDMRNIAQQLARIDQALGAVNVACTIRELISGGLSDVGNAAAFSKRLALARNSLQKLKECADATDGVFVALCDAVDARGRSLVDWLVVTKSKSSLAVAVSDCVNVLDPIEVDMISRRIAEHVRHELIEPLLNRTFCDLQLIENDRMLTVKLRRPKTPLPTTVILENMRLVVDLLYNVVFHNSKMLMALLGRTLWPSLESEVTDRVLCSGLPTDVAALLECREALRQSIRSFKETLRQCHFASSFTGLDGFLDNIDVRFAHTLATRSLAHARKAVIDDSFSLASPGTEHAASFVDDDVTGLVSAEYASRHPEFQFSTSATECAFVFHSLLIQWRRAPPQIADRLFQAARYVMVLFAEVRPLYHQRAFETIPSLSMLFYADCMFLAYHAARSAVIYGPGSGLSSLINLMASAGRNAFDRQYKALSNACAEVRDRLDRLAHLDSKAEYDKTVLGVSAQVRDWRQLETTMSPILSKTVVRCILQSLCGELMEPMTEWILDRKDIPLEFANRTYAVFAIVADFAETIADSGGEPDPFQRIRMRFATLQNILHPDQSLSSLGREVDAGQLDVFSRRELHSLIAALFEPSEKRQSLLSAIDRRAASQ